MPINWFRFLRTDRTKQNGIYPIFFPQPALYGEAEDPVTGVHLERLEAGGIPGRCRW